MFPEGVRRKARTPLEQYKRSNNRPRSIGSLKISVATKATRSKIKQIYKVRWSLLATVNYMRLFKICELKEALKGYEGVWAIA